VTDTEAPDKNGIDKAIEAVEHDQGADKIVKADVRLNGDRRLVILAPHPLTPDDFESAIVVLLNMRAASEARVAADRPIVVPTGPKLLRPNGRPLT
jgi:hypothetical protein